MRKRKFYTFRAGQDVPRWMMGVVMPEGKSIPKSFKMTFGTSCMVMHTKGCNAAIMQANNKTIDCLIRINGIGDAKIGCANGAAGVFAVEDSSLSEMHRLYSEHEDRMVSL